MAVKLVNKVNNGTVEVNPEYAKVLLANKATWAKEADYLKGSATEAEAEK